MIVVRAVGVCLVLLVASVGVCPVHSSLADGDVSGDELEHWILYPLKGEVTLDPDPVQALHLALFGANAIRATWLNPVQFQLGNFSFRPMCKYGTSASSLTKVAPGFAYSYEAGMFRQTLNTATLDLSVLPDLYSTVYYVCGDPGYGWSLVYHFMHQTPSIVNPRLSAPPGRVRGDNPGLGTNRAGGSGVVQMAQGGRRGPPDTTHAPKLIVLIADMGVTHAEDTMAGIAQFVANGSAQLVVHAGDISYADNFSKGKHNNSYIWTEYMNELQHISPWLPYMTCPGNHEAQFDFAAYLNWMPMPMSAMPSRFWYSFDYMGVHFLSFSTEHPFDPNSEQFRFLREDLTAANANRVAVPWVLVFGHRPLYCTSEIAHERCQKEAPLYRSYLEDLFYEQKVDVYLCGHNHNYERTFPVYKEKATQKDFHNPQAPVYIVDGAAGNPEPNDPSYKRDVDWRAYVYGSIDNGFLLAEPSQTQLRFLYVRSKDRAVIDGFTITRD